MKQRFCVSRCCCGDTCPTFSWAIRGECFHDELQFIDGVVIADSPNSGVYDNIVNPDTRGDSLSGLTPRQVYERVAGNGLESALHFGPPESLGDSIHTVGYPDVLFPVLGGPTSYTTQINEQDIGYSEYRIVEGGAVISGSYELECELFFNQNLGGRQVVISAGRSGFAGLTNREISLTVNDNSRGASFVSYVNPVTEFRDSFRHFTDRNPDGSRTVIVTASGSYEDRYELDSNNRGVLMRRNTTASLRINGEELYNSSLNNQRGGARVITRCRVRGLSALAPQIFVTSDSSGTFDQIVQSLSGFQTVSISGSLPIGNEPPSVISQKYYRVSVGFNSPPRIYLLYVDSSGIGSVITETEFGGTTYLMTVDDSSGDPAITFHTTSSEGDFVSTGITKDDRSFTYELTNGVRRSVSFSIEGPFFDCQPRIVNSLR